MELCEGSAIYLDPLLVNLFVKAHMIILLSYTNLQPNVVSQTPSRISQCFDAERGIMKEVQARDSIGLETF